MINNVSNFKRWFINTPHPEIGLTKQARVIFGYTLFGILAFFGQASIESCSDASAFQSIEICKSAASE
jgi:hypothetical protein